ncbi:MAG: choice-of-anchor X domain-containing protein, partial [Polyangia bacterium]
TVQDAWVMADAGPATGRLTKLSYHDDGQDGDEVAGDLRYTNRLVPSQVPALKQAAQVHLSAVVSCCEGVRRLFVREFTYAPRKVVEIVGITDSVRSGSLAVTLDVNVLDRGTYDFEANLMSADGSVPIGYSQMNYTLAPGRQSVDLVFFGRMFAERGLDGPYLVRDVRGMLLSLDGGEHNIPFEYGATYLTKPWRRAEFSPSEWDAPEKREKIATLERLIAETAAGKIGGPTAQPSHIDIDEHGVAHVVNDPPPPK